MTTSVEISRAMIDAIIASVTSVQAQADGLAVDKANNIVELTQTFSNITVGAGQTVERDLSNWVRVCSVTRTDIAVTGLTGSYDFLVFGKNTFLDADKMYEADGIPSSPDYSDSDDWPYTDRDNMAELHIRIVNNDGGNAGVFSITLTALVFAS